MESRFVRKDRRIYDFSLCKACGTAGFTSGTCTAVVCKACLTVQCHSNGGGNGRCSVCYVGLLPGWSGTNCGCSRKDCDQRAVAIARKRAVCANHLGKTADDIAQRLAEREKSWVLVP